MAPTPTAALKTDPAVQIKKKEARILNAGGQIAKIYAITKKGDWKAARGKFERYCATPDQPLPKIISLAAVMNDWVAVLDAESQYIRQAGLPGPHALRNTLLGAVIQARMELWLAVEARQLAARRRAHAPHQFEWWRREAQALAKLEDYEAALALGLESWRLRSPHACLLVVPNLLSLGRIGECHDFIRQLPEAHKDTSFARARLQFHGAREDREEALSEMLALEPHIPVLEFHLAVARLAALARRKDLLDPMLSQLKIWSQSQDGTQFAQAGPAILSNHFYCVYDWPAIKPLANELMLYDLMPGPALILSKLFFRAGDYSAAETVARATLRNFPSAILIWRQLIAVLTMLGETAAGTVARVRMREIFPLDSYLIATSAAPPRTWDLEDLPDLFAHNLDKGDAGQQAKFLAALGEIALGGEHIEKLSEVAATATPAVKGQVDLMIAPLKDAQLIATSIQSPVDMAAFAPRVAEVRACVTATRRAFTELEGYSVDLGYGMPECLRLIERVDSGSPPACIYTRESYAQAVQLAEILVRRIREREPTSLVRIGDGDAHFLPPHPATTEHREADRDAIQEIWWGTTRMRDGILKRIEADFVRALTDSTILAVIPPWRYLAEMSKKKYSFAHRGILNCVNYCANMDYNGVMFTSMHYPNDFHKWNIWPELLGSASSVSYISCHDLRLYLRETFGLKVDHAVVIPGEKQYSALFSDGGAEVLRSDTLLDRHQTVCDEIQPAPGGVYLVAAGFLGKIYCDLVRERGGVAIDIGSLADYWMGFSTRRYRLEQLTRAALPNLLIKNHPLRGVEHKERILGVPAVVRSSGDCRYNIGDAIDEAFVRNAMREKRLLRVIGHPRCASAYMATIFMEQGVEIGHEKLLADGISSWMCAADDLRVPFGDAASYEIDFAHTVSHVRDPRDALPSILLENGIPMSFNFRRLHLLRAFDVDLARFGTAIERAVASLVYWYEMIERRQPARFFRVETAGDEIAEFVRTLGRDRPISALRSNEASPHGSGRLKGTPESLRVNNSLRKFGRPTQAIASELFASLDPYLKDALAGYCDRYVYPYPWKELSFRAQSASSGDQTD